jgi:hypothetical protein
VVVQQVVGLNPLSSQLQGILRHVISSLEPSKPAPSSLEDLVHMLPTAIEAAASRLSQSQKLIVIIDGADKLDESIVLDFLYGDSVQAMSWFPRDVPSNVRVVLCMRPGTAYNSIAAWQPRVISATTLGERERAALTRVYMASACKDRAAQLLSDSRVCALQFFKSLPHFGMLDVDLMFIYRSSLPFISVFRGLF